MVPAQCLPGRCRRERSLGYSPALRQCTFSSSAARPAPLPRPSTDAHETSLENVRSALGPSAFAFTVSRQPGACGRSISRPNRYAKILFWGCFIALITTSYAFISRMILCGGQFVTGFGLDKVAVGEPQGAGIWPFGVSIMVFSLFIDRLGYKVAMFFPSAASSSTPAWPSRPARRWLRRACPDLRGRDPLWRRQILLLTNHPRPHFGTMPARWRADVERHGRHRRPVHRLSPGNSATHKLAAINPAIFQTVTVKK